MSKIQNPLSNHVQNNSYLKHKTKVSLDLQQYYAQASGGHEIVCGDFSHLLKDSAGLKITVSQAHEAWEDEAKHWSNALSGIFGTPLVCN